MHDADESGSSPDSDTCEAKISGLLKVEEVGYVTALLPEETVVEEAADEVSVVGADEISVDDGAGAAEVDENDIGVGSIGIHPHEGS